MTDEFATLPPVSEKAKEEMADNFYHYLFFETIFKGCRRYTCSACGKTFERGEAVPLRTYNYNDVILYHAKHNSEQKCPLCGAKAEVKNLKICNRSKLAQFDHVAVFLANSPDDVWVRCFNYWKEYHIVTAGQRGMTEVMRYHLQPGKAEFWVRCSATENGWLKRKIFGEAFLWNHGLWTEKYPWYSYEDNMSISETFLKYHSFGEYKHHGNYGGGVPAMKYMCWYAVHPQIEMLVKLGHWKTVDEMVFYNTDNKAILNWNARKPWDLYGLPKEVYDHWRKRYYGDMKTFKVYKAFKGKTVKDLKLAETALDFNHQSLRAAKRMSSLARRYGTTIKEIISYCEKVSAKSGGGCWHCPGIASVEAFNMWCDYLDMAHGAKADKNLVVFPSDLKAAHDAFIITANFRKNKLSMKQMKAHAEKRSEELRKKFPTVKKIYSRLQSKYAYTSGEYAIVVPKGIEDIVLDGLVLGHCTERTERYYDRIASKESYILFLRKADAPDVPWYTLEAEPNGTLRQKRTNGDVQLQDLNDALPFLKEWQSVVAQRLSKSDKALAKRSAQLRREGYAELRETKTVIHYGALAGKLLADVLEKDLMEATA